MSYIYTYIHRATDSASRAVVSATFSWQAGVEHGGYDEVVCECSMLKSVFVSVVNAYVCVCMQMCEMYVNV